MVTFPVQCSHPIEHCANRVQREYLKMYLKFQVFWGRERCATGGYATLVCLYIPRKMDDYDDVRYYFCVQHSGVV